MLSNEQIAIKLLFPLLRAGLYGVPVKLDFLPTQEDCNHTLDLATIHGVVALAGDGLEGLSHEQRPPKELLLQWIGQMVVQKGQYVQQHQMVEELERLWSDAGIGCTELKGNAIGKYYRIPESRYSCDFDCLLTNFEAGNKVVEAHGVEVNRDFYKNSSFYWKGLYVENHQFCTPVRGNKDMKRIERKLRRLLAEGTEKAMANFNALFLMEHSWAHFFENALTLKQLCDWAVFRNACGEMVDWAMFETEAKACGFWRFAESFGRLADLLDGETTMEALTKEDRLLLEDILAENRAVSMNEGWKTRFQLLKNYFDKSWKYKIYSNHSAMFSLLRTVNGFVFDRNPRI